MFNFLDPFEWLAGKMNEIAKGLSTLFEVLIINPVRTPRNQFTDFLVGNGWALGDEIIYGVIFATICLAFFLKRYITRFMEALVALFVIAILFTLFEDLCNTLIDLGDGLSRAMFFYTPQQKGSSAYLALPGMSSLLAETVALAHVLFWGSLDAAIAVLYWTVILVFQILLPVAIALKPLGKRATQFLHMVIALGIVSMVVGRPVMIMLIELGKVLADQIARPANSFVTSVILIGSLMTAALSQVALLVAAYKVSNAVEGAVKSRVSGTVKASVARLQHPTQRGREAAAHRSALVRQANERREVQRDNTRRRRTGQVAVVATVAGVIPHPAAKAVSLGAGLVHGQMSGRQHTPNPNLKTEVRNVRNLAQSRPTKAGTRPPTTGQRPPAGQNTPRPTPPTPRIPKGPPT